MGFYPGSNTEENITDYREQNPEEAKLIEIINDDPSIP